MRGVWPPILILCFFISQQINGDTYHYHVLRKICPTGSYHDPIRDRCRRVPGGGEVIKYNLDARCSTGFTGLLAHGKKSRYYFVCKHNSVLTCMCKPKETFNRVQLRCERSQGRRGNTFTQNVVDNIMKKYKCTMSDGYFENDQCFMQSTSTEKPSSYESTNISYLQSLLNYIIFLRSLIASSEESWESSTTYSPAFLIEIPDLPITTENIIATTTAATTTTSKMPVVERKDEVVQLTKTVKEDIDEWMKKWDVEAPTTPTVTTVRTAPNQIQPRVLTTNDETTEKAVVSGRSFDENTTKSEKIIHHRLAKMNESESLDFIDTDKEIDDNIVEVLVYEYYYEDDPDHVLFIKKLPKEMQLNSSLRAFDDDDELSKLSTTTEVIKTTTDDAKEEDELRSENLSTTTEIPSTSTISDGEKLSITTKESSSDSEQVAEDLILRLEERFEETSTTEQTSTTEVNPTAFDTTKSDNVGFDEPIDLIMSTSTTEAPPKVSTMENIFSTTEVPQSTLRLTTESSTITQSSLTTESSTSFESSTIEIPQTTDAVENETTTMDENFSTTTENPTTTEFLELLKSDENQATDAILRSEFHFDFDNEKISEEISTTELITTTTENDWQAGSPLTTTAEGNLISTTSMELISTTLSDGILTTEFDSQETTEETESMVGRVEETTSNPLYWRDPNKYDIEFYYEYIEEDYDDNMDVIDDDIENVNQNNNRRRDTSMEYYVESISASREMRGKKSTEDFYSMNY